MAFRYFQSAISFICGYEYSQIVQHWGVDGDTSHSKFDLARDIVQGIITPTGGSYSLAQIMTILAEDCFISAVRCREVNDDPAPSFVQAFPVDAHIGEFSADSTAAQVSGCVIWLTGADAGLTGRTFFPGVPTDAIGLGRFTSTYKGVVGDVIAGIIAGVDAPLNTYLPFVRHGTPANQFAKIIHGYVSATPGTQRRRLLPF